jgi:hypothetical protein
VSRRVQIVAKQAADDLKAERLEAARSVSGSGPDTPSPGAADSMPAKGQAKGFTKTTGGLKKDASTRAAGARRQAKRDAR